MCSKAVIHSQRTKVVISNCTRTMEDNFAIYLHFIDNQMNGGGKALHACPSCRRIPANRSHTNGIPHSRGITSLRARPLQKPLYHLLQPIWLHNCRRYIDAFRVKSVPVVSCQYGWHDEDFAQHCWQRYIKAKRYRAMKQSRSRKAKLIAVAFGTIS